ncbi:MAG: hypothetical protein Q4A18_05005 [Rikenellaceae bacterium]|nr:hypothetical protein [Rikenellaceae bacterium]
MRFDPARLSLIPAFLLLVLLVVVAMCHTAGVATPMPPVEGLPAIEELPIAPLGMLINRFGVAHPTWAHALGALMIILSAMSLGRLTARYKLYGSGTMLAIPLYALSMLGVVICDGWFQALVASTLATLAIKNFCYANRSGFCFDNIFRGGMYLSLLILVEPKALPLLMAYPIAVWQFRRTTRESLVALSGLLLPVATLCYLNWALGGTFTAPATALYRLALAGEWTSTLISASLVEQLFVATLLVLSLFAFSLFHINSYTLSTRSRHTLLYASKLIPFAAATLLMPHINMAHLALLIVPTTLLLPVLFIRTRRPIANTLLAVVVVAAFAALFFSCYNPF